MPEGDERLELAASVLAGRTIVAVTGAGMSTDSGIPDYRGAGAPVRTPMTFQQFRADPYAHKRYWAGSHLGWSRFQAVEPNTGHRVLADLERRGIVNGVITQNVDSLHTRAGSLKVVEVHGSMTDVVCLRCGQYYSRADIAARMDADNPWLSDPGAVTINPDGDAEVSQVDEMIVPRCTRCGGMLKPDVVFFGELIPPATYRLASALVSGADAMLIAGSSLVVNSGIRMLELARRRELPVVIVNRGMTKGDDRATVKLDAGTSQTLTALAALVRPRSRGHSPVRRDVGA